MKKIRASVSNCRTGEAGKKPRRVEDELILMNWIILCKRKKHWGSILYEKWLISLVRLAVSIYNGLGVVLLYVLKL
jgi:hypothetical protein